MSLEQIIERREKRQKQIQIKQQNQSSKVEAELEKQKERKSNMTIEEAMTLKIGDKVLTPRNTIVIICSGVIYRNGFHKIKIEMPSGKKNWCDNIEGYFVKKVENG